MKPISLVACLAAIAGAQSVTIQVLADSGRISISPWIYGRNNSLSLDPSKPVSDSLISLYKDAGVRAFRENGGNNATKYNWRRKLTSAPDWYNNVYGADWDYAATTLQNQLPGTQGVSAFQLLGWAANNTNNNFGDYAWSQAWDAETHQDTLWKGHSWTDFSAPRQNLAGGGVVDTVIHVTPSGSYDMSHALVEGDATKYLQVWPADSTVGILPHWFGLGGLGLDSTRFRYWGMDNEPDCWNGTHDDVDSDLTVHTLSVEDYVQRWVKVAVAARRAFPGIRLVGPVSASEWQWYNWPTGAISYKGSTYCYPEYLIKRLAEVQDSTGVRMLDVYDIHLYLSASSQTDILQTHRLLWDSVYVDPNANGVKTVYGGQWKDTVSHQEVFLRVQKWLDKYFGTGNGIKMGSTESGINGAVSSSASPTAVWYSSLLGTMADHGAELFTAWSWYPGMWETLHLFSRYAHSTRVKSVSTLDSLVSGYSSISAAGDSLLVILVNRDASNSHATTVNLSGFAPVGNATTLQLAGLNGETFHSHTSNALKSGTATVSGTNLSLTLPKMSITAIQLLGMGHAVTGVHPRASPTAKVTMLPGILQVEAGEEGTVRILDFQGRTVASSSLHQGLADIAVGGLARGLYTVQWPGGLKRVALLGD